MKNQIGLSLVYLCGLLLALTFQNCSGYKSFETTGEENGSSFMLFSGVDAQEPPDMNRVEESNLSMPTFTTPTATEMEIIEELRDSLELVKVYIGRERIFFFGHCNPEYGPYTELELHGGGGFIPSSRFYTIGGCAPYRGTDPRFVGKTIAVGTGRFFEESDLSTVDVSLRYLRSYGRVPGSRYHADGELKEDRPMSNRELHEYVKTVAVSVSADPRVDQIFADLNARSGPVNHLEFERLMEEGGQRPPAQPEPTDPPTPTQPEPVDPPTPNQPEPVDPPVTTDPEPTCDVVETTTEINLVTSIFTTWYDRIPNPDGRCLWVKAYRKHSDRDRLEYQILMGTSGPEDLETLEQLDDRRKRAINLTVDRTGEIPPNFSSIFTTREKQIIEAYNMYFDRNPRGDGLKYWHDSAIENSWSPVQMVRRILENAGSDDRDYVMDARYPQRAEKVRSFFSDNGFSRPAWLNTAIIVNPNPPSQPEPEPNPNPHCDFVEQDFEIQLVNSIYTKWYDQLPDLEGRCFWINVHRGHSDRDFLEYQILMGTSDSDHLDTLRQLDDRRESAINLTVDRTGQIPPNFSSIFTTNESRVVEIFQHRFDRVPRGTGLRYWAEMADDNGWSRDRLEAYILSSAQAADRAHILSSTSRINWARSSIIAGGLEVPIWLQ